MVASFHCCGTSPPFHTSTRMAWKCSRTVGSAGSSILSSSTTRESGPGAFPLCIARIARLVSSSVGADPSGTESPVVWCCRSLLHLKNLAHLEDLSLVPQQNTVLVLNILYIYSITFIRVKRGIKKTRSMHEIYKLQYRLKYLICLLCVIETIRVDAIDSGRKAT